MFANQVLVGQMVTNVHLNLNGKTFCKRLVPRTPVFDLNSSILLSNESTDYFERCGCIPSLCK